ncbi:MAG: hypothetical protein P1V20_29235 [Verrucomicrobiales bacterium]|nr:hypothetical protein [Verrucomicrobiales bacterium]
MQNTGVISRMRMSEWSGPELMRAGLTLPAINPAQREGMEWS